MADVIEVDSFSSFSTYQHFSPALTPTLTPTAVATDGFRRTARTPDAQIPTLTNRKTLSGWRRVGLLICWFSVRFRAGSPHSLKSTSYKVEFARTVTVLQQIVCLLGDRNATRSRPSHKPELVDPMRVRRLEARPRVGS